MRQDRILHIEIHPSLRTEIPSARRGLSPHSGMRFCETTAIASPIGSQEQLLTGGGSENESQSKAIDRGGIPDFQRVEFPKDLCPGWKAVQAHCSVRSAHVDGGTVVPGRQHGGGGSGSRWPNAGGSTVDH